MIIFLNVGRGGVVRATSVFFKSYFERSIRIYSVCGNRTRKTTTAERAGPRKMTQIGSGVSASGRIITGEHSRQPASSAALFYFLGFIQ